MKLATELARGGRAALPVLRLWLVFAGCAAAVAIVVAVLQRADAALSRSKAPVASSASPRPARPAAAPSRSALPPVAFAPTFAEAAGSLRAGRHADAYGRFVALAEEGDADAARIALLMHRFGPELFGSEWDASREQLEAWTASSEAAARRDLAQRGDAAATTLSAASP